MEWIIILIIIVGAIWYWKTSKWSYKQVNLTFNYLSMLMLACKTKSDFEKLLWRMYSYDSNTLPVEDFKLKWEAICEAAKVHVIKKDYGISAVVVDRIAENIYDDPTNKRYIKDIESQYPDDIPLAKLKEHNFSNGM